MKKTILVAILTISFSISFAQDKIVQLNLDTIICKVTEITSDNVKYKYKGEDLINNISKNLVKEIVFNSGRIQEFNTKISINGEEDWEKVQVTYLESDIKGLFKIKEIKVKSKAFMSTDIGKQQEKALIKLKKEAAKNRSHIVLILNEIQSDYKDAPRITLTAALYKY